MRRNRQRRARPKFKLEQVERAIGKMFGYEEPVCRVVGQRVWGTSFLGRTPHSAVMLEMAKSSPAKPKQQGDGDGNGDEGNSEQE
jgi:hypothetical protein